MSILITGIHGFVGNNLVNALKTQHKIYGLDIVSPQKDGVIKTFGWNELEQIPSVDVIIHLAGKAHDTKNLTNAQVYFDINTGLTQKIFDWFLTINATKFIFFSSVKAAADEVEGDILTEEAVPAPKGPYGESKLAAERYIINEWEKGREGDQETRRGGERAKGRKGEGVTGREGDGATSRMGEWANGRLGDESISGEQDHIVKKVYILRPCMIHGPGNKGNLNLLYKMVQKGLPWPLGAFENKRSFCSVDNLKFVIQQLIEKGIEPGIYQVADDEALSTNEIIRLIASAQNRKSRIWNIPRKLISLSARIGDVLHLPLNSERFTLWN